MRKWILAGIAMGLAGCASGGRYPAAVDAGKGGEVGNVGHDGTGDIIADTGTGGFSLKPAATKTIISQIVEFNKKNADSIHPISHESMTFLAREIKDGGYQGKWAFKGEVVCVADKDGSNPLFCSVISPIKFDLNRWFDR